MADSTDKYLRELAAHLNKALEEERKRIAREVHDELGQSLTALKIDITSLEEKLKVNPGCLRQELDSMLSIVNKTLEAVKTITSELRPGVLDQLGLIAAIEWQLKEFASRTGLSFDTNLDESIPQLPEEIQVSLFRIFQELLTNIMRHSEARHVTVSMTLKSDMLTLMVHDDGKGIEPEMISSSISLGIRGMRERAQYLGGTFDISGGSESGTSVIVRIPFKWEKSC